MKGLKAGIMVISIGMLLGACTGSDQYSSNSINSDDVSVHVYQPLVANCGVTTVFSRGSGGGGGAGGRIGDVLASDLSSYSRGSGGGGGGARPTLALKSECSQFSVEVSGVCNDCNSVIVEADGKEISLEASDGQFGATMNIGSTEGSITLTPMSESGELGESMIVNLATIPAIQINEIQ